MKTVCENIKRSRVDSVPAITAFCAVRDIFLSFGLRLTTRVKITF